MVQDMAAIPLQQRQEADMTTAIEVHGACDERFRAVERAFAQNFSTYDEVGAALAVMVDGEMVVDIWAGHADAGRTRAWERDTIANVYSTTKGMAAICAHRLIERGLPARLWWGPVEGRMPRFFNSLDNYTAH
jgi:CubicO group peptidase (beta-lactamase class C family)